ncbi:serine/threonine-protein kinase [Salinibacter grassmerensis]|uniref:serine/threonine-protein kinase n=1 Tax=Salinibacter grassmerensis TaxID=3040353 RepID=UPI0021E86BC6|nr:serine/threonine-protein kinase [Salinibacter grassmerensis]
MPDPGDVLDGYRLNAVIGRGGMGTVYRATDQALEKTVALKVIAPHLADDPTFVRRFREEAKALARLDADGIVDVYTLRETEEALFFVMEHIEGPSLQTVLRRRGRLEPPQALSLLRQVLTAVGHAHASGVLHRDLKPSNILIDADGQAVITDFGLAKILASDADLTATHDQLGTVAYMSPEQVKGLRNVDTASDLFAVGLIAYEVLTGQLPFDRSGTDFVVQRAIVDASFPPPSTYAPEVPPAVEQVVLDLLSKDPAARPPDAQAARTRLPIPQTADEEPLLTPDTPPAPDVGFTAWQWAGLAAGTLLMLMGTYAGVRGTLGLPILSTAGPAPSETTRTAATPAGPSSAEQKSTPEANDTGLSSRTGQDPSTETSSSVNPSSSDEAPSDESDPSAAAPSEDSTPPGASTDNTSGATSAPDDEPSPPPEPATGAITVRSSPDGATVRLNEQTIGRTPLTIDDLAPGTYRLLLDRNDHRAQETTVPVAGNDTTVVSPTLPPRPAVVRLGARPDGTVRIDGTPQAPTADGLVVDSLSPGPHQITITSTLGRWAMEVTLDPGETYERTIDFTERVESAVTARATGGPPLPNATVTVNGDTVGYTPQRLRLRVGERTIRVMKDGYIPAEQTVRVEPGMETPLVFELAPEPE